MLTQISARRTVKWTTTCPSLETITHGTGVSVHTRLSTITRYMTVESHIPCATCAGPNYPPSGATVTEAETTPEVGHQRPPLPLVPLLPPPGAPAPNLTVPGVSTPVVVTAAAPGAERGGTKSAMIMVQLFAMALALLLS